MVASVREIPPTLARIPTVPDGRGFSKNLPRSSRNGEFRDDPKRRNAHLFSTAFFQAKPRGLPRNNDRVSAPGLRAKKKPSTGRVHVS